MRRLVRFVKSATLHPLSLLDRLQVRPSFLQRAFCCLLMLTCFPIIKVLQLFLSSSKSTLKFAAIRTLSALALTHAGPVSTCNVDIENLITDSNRSIATYAITTLLKVCIPYNLV